METAWYVCQTNRHKEGTAHMYLGERGICTYLPRIVQWPRPAVGSAVAPMFPGYLFCLLDLANDFQRVSHTPGVRSLVGFGGGPVPIDGEVVQYLRNREGPDGLIHCPRPTPGSSEVRIVNGPFRGLTAIVERYLPARERVRVLMDILQRTTCVELPERWVRRA